LGTANREAKDEKRTGLRSLGVCSLAGVVLFGSGSFVCSGRFHSIGTYDQHRCSRELEKANVVFNMDHLAFSGDMPVGIKYMHLLANRFKELGIRGQIIGIFHGDAAYMTLTDKVYNAHRNVGTGNPYKGLITELIKQGVQIEECAVSMKSHNWINQDLLPGTCPTIRDCRETAPKRGGFLALNQHF
jgi:intracellular sulfur oxidation DsrE/DsrF family protein